MTVKEILSREARVIGLFNFRLRAGNNDGGLRHRIFGIDLGGGVLAQGFYFQFDFPKQFFYPNPFRGSFFLI